MILTQKWTLLLPCVYLVTLPVPAKMAAAPPCQSPEGSEECSIDEQIDASPFQHPEMSDEGGSMQSVLGGVHIFDPHSSLFPRIFR